MEPRTEIGQLKPLKKEVKFERSKNVFFNISILDMNDMMLSEITTRVVKFDTKPGSYNIVPQLCKFLQLTHKTSENLKL